MNSIVGRKIPGQVTIQTKVESHNAGSPGLKQAAFPFLFK